MLFTNQFWKMSVQFQCNSRQTLFSFMQKKLIPAELVAVFSPASLSAQSHSLLTSLADQQANHEKVFPRQSFSWRFFQGCEMSLNKLAKDRSSLEALYTSPLHTLIRLITQTQSTRCSTRQNPKSKAKLQTRFTETKGLQCTMKQN